MTDTDARLAELEAAERARKKAHAARMREYRRRKAAAAMAGDAGASKAAALGEAVDVDAPPASSPSSSSSCPLHATEPLGGGTADRFRAMVPPVRVAREQWDAPPPPAPPSDRKQQSAERFALVCSLLVGPFVHESLAALPDEMLEPLGLSRDKVGGWVLAAYRESATTCYLRYGPESLALPFQDEIIFGSMTALAVRHNFRQLKGQGSEAHDHQGDAGDEPKESSSSEGAPPPTVGGPLSPDGTLNIEGVPEDARVDFGFLP